MAGTQYTFALTGDFQQKLAEMSNDKNVIEINPLNATKAEFACYQMYVLMENSKNVSDMAANMEAYRATVDTLKGQVSDLERSVTARDSDITELKSDLAVAQATIAAQGRDIEHLMNRADKSDSDSLELERHSRSSNLRLGEIKESENEDCLQKVNAVFEQLGLHGMDIENCHRVGKIEQGKHRQIIVRFVRRLQLREVYAKRKDFFEAHIPLYEDIPYKDLVVKKKFKKEISAHYKKKDKCYFSKGAWYVNKKKTYW